MGFQGPPVPTPVVLPSKALISSNPDNPLEMLAAIWTNRVLFPATLVSKKGSGFRFRTLGTQSTNSEAKRTELLSAQSALEMSGTLAKVLGCREASF